MKKKLVIVILAISIAMLWLTPVFAAQGQITEVNPSGVGTSSNSSNDNNQSGGHGDNPDANRSGNAGDNGAAGSPVIQDGQLPNQNSQTDTGQTD